MNKILTSILVILTFVVLVLMCIYKFRSLTDLEAEATDTESTTKRKVSENGKETNTSTKSKKVRNHDPEDSGSLISKLKANITEDDVLITGGYKADNGNMRYSFIQACKEEIDGKDVVSITIKNIEISPETANDSNLDYLETDDNKIFDHFGVLPSDEHKKTVKRLNGKGMKVLAMPKVGLQPGAKGRLYIGDDNALKHVDISVKSTILNDGSFDIELEAKQNRN